MADQPADRRASPLPQEPEYWERLAQRIRDDAAAPLARYAAAGTWYELLARQAPWLVAAAAMLVLALLLALPRRSDPAAYRWMQASLSPAEVAGSLMAGPAPPRVDVILAQFPPAGLVSDPSDATPEVR